VLVQNPIQMFILLKCNRPNSPILSSSNQNIMYHNKGVFVLQKMNDLKNTLLKIITYIDYKNEQTKRKNFHSEDRI